jgi:hypothetical protein
VIRCALPSLLNASVRPTRQGSWSAVLRKSSLHGVGCLRRGWFEPRSGPVRRLRSGVNAASLRERESGSGRGSTGLAAKEYDRTRPGTVWERRLRGNLTAETSDTPESFLWEEGGSGTSYERLGRERCSGALDERSNYQLEWTWPSFPVSDVLQDSGVGSGDVMPAPRDWPRHSIHRYPVRVLIPAGVAKG